MSTVAPWSSIFSCCVLYSNLGFERMVWHALHWRGESIQKKFRLCYSWGRGQLNQILQEGPDGIEKNQLSLMTNQWPIVRETNSSVPPSNSLVSFSNPWRTFRADATPFKDFALCVASETLRTARARRRDPRTQKQQKLLLQTLNVRFLKTHLFLWFKYFEY